jgi:hypothetical protein
VPYQPRATFDNPYGPQVSFRTLDVLPPAAYYVGLDDQLVFEVFTDHANTSYQLVVRLLNPQGAMQVETATLNNFQSGYQSLTGNLTGIEGYILSACVSAPGSVPGESYCRVRLMRAPYLATGITTATLLAGYASDKFSLSYPGTQLQYATEGPGKLTTVTASVPAGAQWSVKPALGTRWRINSGTFVLTTSAATGNRQIQLVIYDHNDTLVGSYPAPATQAPSSLVTYSFSPAGSAVSTGSAITISTPTPLLVDGAGYVATYSPNFDAADQYANIAVQVEEWVGL